MGLSLVNQIREQMKDWRRKNYPGATGTTIELLNYWQRDGRRHRLFFAQIEAAETIIFLREARSDYLQGIDVPLGVEGYQQAIRNRITVDWHAVAQLHLDPMNIPPEVEMKAGLPNNQGRCSLMGPGRIENVDLNPYRLGRRFQELVFELARDLARDYTKQPGCTIPVHVLFPQIAKIVEKYLNEKVRPIPPVNILDVFLSLYYGWVIERLVEAIKPDTSLGEAPEIPRYEKNRGPGSTAEVDFWTSRDVREVIHSHLNYVVADTKKWEQVAAYSIDKHEKVDAFVKNAGGGSKDDGRLMFTKNRECIWRVLTCNLPPDFDSI